MRCVMAGIALCQGTWRTTMNSNDNIHSKFEVAQSRGGMISKVMRLETGIFQRQTSRSDMKSCKVLWDADDTTGISSGGKGTSTAEGARVGMFSTKDTQDVSRIEREFIIHEPFEVEIVPDGMKRQRGRRIGMVMNLILIQRFHGDEMICHWRWTPKIRHRTTKCIRTHSACLSNHMVLKR